MNQRNNFYRKALAAAVISAATGLASLTTQAAAPYLVTNSNDSGPGSLREALASGAEKIVIKPTVGDIMVTSSLEYVRRTPVSIKGGGQVITDIDIPDGDPILLISKGADLSVSNLSFEGPGDYSIEGQGGGKGIYVQVPKDRAGLVNVKLTNVSVIGTGNHGVHISDCSGGDGCGAGDGEDDNTGSPASIRVQLTKVTIDGVGFGKQDADGLRVDDRGEGDIILSATNSTFKNVGGDGIELDEGNAGGVHINVRNSRFKENGAYCFDTDGKKGPFDPIAVDHNCNDDGDPDVDDAFDIDEAGPGGISGLVTNLKIIDNFDEGLDFDTEGEGDDNFVDLDIMAVYAAGNADEAIKVSEEGDASVVVNMRAIKIGGDVEVEEEDAGDLRVTVNGSYIGDDLKLSQEDPGTGTVKLRGTTVVDKKDFENVTEI